MNRKFAEDIAGKRVLYIPIVSMRSYANQKYDLACDGNVNRFMSNFLDLKNKEYDLNVGIILPSCLDVTDTGNDLTHKFSMQMGNSVEIIRLSNYPKGGAGELRSLSGAASMMKEIQHLMKDVDLVIYESNYLGLFIESIKKFKKFQTGYWCPVSVTLDGCPEFLKQYQEIDKKLSECADYMWVASKKQYDFFYSHLYNKNLNVTRLSKNPILMNPSLSLFAFEPNESILNLTDHLITDGYKLVYLPFRLTDSGYSLDKILEALSNLKTVYKICVLYTDPNDSGRLSTENSDNSLRFIKVPKDRNSYYTMLSEVDCVVPYLEDIDNILHAAVFELDKLNTKVISMINSVTSFSKGSINLGRIEDLELAFETLFTKEKCQLNIIEGFDRIGKDSFLVNLSEKSYKNGAVYIQHPVNLPSYRKEQDEFVKWLKIYLEKQANDLIKLSNYSAVTMTRLFVSDAVYGHLFARKPIAEHVRRRLARYFDFNSISLIWKDFQNYVQRCEFVNEELEYSEEEFERIQNLYRIETKKENIIEVEHSMSREDLYNELTALLKFN